MVFFPSTIYPTQTGISSSSSSTSSLVTTSQEVRRGRPVTAPNSLPRLRSCPPNSPFCSLGNGPSPTRVQYALVSPITDSIALGATPVPIAAPPEVALEEVTKGYVP